MSYRVRRISQIVKLSPAVSDKLYIARARIHDELFSFYNDKRTVEAKIEKCKKNLSVQNIKKRFQHNLFYDLVLPIERVYVSYSFALASILFSFTWCGGGKFINSFDQRT